MSFGPFSRYVTTTSLKPFLTHDRAETMLRMGMPKSAIRPSVRGSPSSLQFGMLMLDREDGTKPINFQGATSGSVAKVSAEGKVASSTEKSRKVSAQIGELIVPTFSLAGALYRNCLPQLQSQRLWRSAEAAVTGYPHSSNTASICSV